MKRRYIIGFTLIELLVVIAIIAILASIAVPVYTSAMMNAQMSEGLSNIRQIDVGLRMYSNDNGGNFPSTTNVYNEPIVTSNDAFRSLVPSYIDNEKVFTVSRSKVGPKSDNKIEPSTEILRAGENHFAYIEGLNVSSNSSWPVVVDSTDGSGHYTTMESDYGGTWKGTKALVARVDGGAMEVPLLGPNNKRYLPRYNDSTLDGLNVTDYMGSDVKLLEPARR